MKEPSNEQPTQEWDMETINECDVLTVIFLLILYMQLVYTVAQ